MYSRIYTLFILWNAMNAFGHDPFNTTNRYSNKLFRCGDKLIICDDKVICRNDQLIRYSAI